MNTLDCYLKAKAQLVDQRLEELLPASAMAPVEVHEAMRYAVFTGGKRFRPVLTLTVAEACGGDEAKVLPTAAALEMIHAYSLIHDDLPCMDNEEYRRGQLTCHKKFGEDIALLAGDALLTQAFEVMDSSVAACVAKAIGSRGMVGGQVADIRKGGRSLTESALEYIHSRKTGALISVSAKVGALLSNVSLDMVTRLERYGALLGFAFQIIDDIMDSDDYAVLLGENEARSKANQMISEGKELIALLGKSAWALNALADYVVERKL